MRRLVIVALILAVLPLAVFSAAGERIEIFQTGELYKGSALGNEVADALKYFENNKSTFGMADPAEELVSQKVEHDRIGMRHVTFAQYFKGVRVVGSEIKVHYTHEGTLKTINGYYRSNLEVDVVPTLSAQKATTSAEVDLLSFFGSGVPDDAELVVFPWRDEAYLCWRLFITSDTPMGRWEYFVDAHDGAVIFKANRIMYDNDIGTGTGVMGDARDHIDTDLDGGVYRMYDDTRQTSNNPHGHNGQMPDGNYIETNDAGASYPGDIVTDADNVWSDSDDQAAAVDAHVYTGLMYDWMLSEFGRNSYDDAGAHMLSSVNRNDGSRFNNAFWNGSRMLILDWTTGWRSLAGCPDVIAHEWAHAVTGSTSGLEYQFESGALNESFSDMMGVAFEFAHPAMDTPDWLMGENGQTSGDAFRSMTNPNLYGQPDAYGTSALFWYDITGCVPVCDFDDPNYNDCCGVHTNSGVGNKWFSLLSDGGTHNSVDVTGIGVEDAIAIAYRANVFYWTSTSDYEAAARGTYTASLDLDPTGVWGRYVVDAWRAVGVFTDCYDDPVALTPGSEMDDEVCVNTFQQYSFPVIADGRSYRITVVPDVDTDVDLFASRDKTDIETLDALDNWSTTCTDASCASSENPGSLPEFVQFMAPNDGVNYTSWFSVVGRLGPEGRCGYHVKLETVSPDGLDVVFIMDITGSTGALLPVWQASMPGVVADIQARFPGARFGLASHLDYPFAPYGDYGEYAYRLESTLSPDPAPMLTALAALNNGWGYDEPESQYEAIYQALTGEGRDLTGDGDFNDVGEIQPGPMGYAPGSQIALFHFTWPPVFHDRDVETTYPYAGAAPVAGRTAAIDACLSKPMFYFGLVTYAAKDGFTDPQTGNYFTEEELAAAADPMQELADTTGGAILYVGPDLSGLDEAIQAALEVVDPSISIVPDSMNWYLANSINNTTVSITMGGTLAEPLANVDPASLVVNGLLTPLSASFLGDEWVLLVSTRDFILSYGTWVGVTQRTFSIEGNFLSGAPFSVEGSFMSVGHLAGDLNVDGSVDITDLTIMVSYLFQNVELTAPLAIADVTGDGVADISDLICIVSHVFEGTDIPCTNN